MDHLATTPKPPYVAVIFTSVRNDMDPEGYARAAERLDRLVRGCEGFLGAESVRDLATGHGVTVSYWRGLEHADNWRRNPEHIKVIAMAYRWYSAYSLRVAVVERDGEYRPVGQHDTRCPGQRR